MSCCKVPGLNGIIGIRLNVKPSIVRPVFKTFMEHRYGVKVVVRTHPIPLKYLDVHAHLGTWEDPFWKPLLESTMADEATRLRYNELKLGGQTGLRRDLTRLIVK
jgi:hypothetical protein